MIWKRAWRFKASFGMQWKIGEGGFPLDEEEISNICFQKLFICLPGFTKLFLLWPRRGSDLRALRFQKTDVPSGATSENRRRLLSSLFFPPDGVPPMTVNSLREPPPTLLAAYFFVLRVELKVTTRLRRRRERNMNPPVFICLRSVNTLVIGFMPSSLRAGIFAPFQGYSPEALDCNRGESAGTEVKFPSLGDRAQSFPRPSRKPSYW